jgi:hypothetical protein
VFGSAPALRLKHYNYPHPLEWMDNSNSRQHTILAQELKKYDISLLYTEMGAAVICQKAKCSTEMFSAFTVK